MKKFDVLGNYRYYKIQSNHSECAGCIFLRSSNCKCPQGLNCRSTSNLENDWIFTHKKRTIKKILENL